LSGVFTWSPTESQGGASYSITVKVTDNGAPLLSDSKPFSVTVNEVNNPPSIGPIANRTVDPGIRLSVSVPASDPDLPAQTLAYMLLSSPGGASLDSSGLFTWTPTQAQASTTNPIVVTATDSGAPMLSATQSFTVIVNVWNPCTGFKGDVSPRPNGNGGVSLSDWSQVGRFAAGLNDFSNTCEFIRADCAPRPCGNGSITIADWVQAGRYALGLDLLVSPCGGPGPDPVPAAQGTRTLAVTNMMIGPGQTNCLQILLNAQGDENAVGFSLNFETNLLTFVSASLGRGASNALLNLNRNDLSRGRVGLALALPTGQTLAAGQQLIAEVCFRAAESAESVSTSVTIVDLPIGREVVDAFAYPLATFYQNGTVFLTSGVAFDAIADLGGRQVRLRLIGPPGQALELHRSSDLLQWTKIADIPNPTGVVEYTDTVPTSSRQSFYRAALP
jgi:hypothetical protein